jgi:hypothetical protein
MCCVLGHWLPNGSLAPGFFVSQRVSVCCRAAGNDRSMFGIRIQRFVVPLDMPSLATL